MAQILVQKANELGVKTIWLASSGAEKSKAIEVLEHRWKVDFTTPAFNPNQANDLVQKFASL